MFRVNLKGTTIPHMVKGFAGASTVVLVPARPGTGVTAGKSVRPVLELAGVSDILTKSYGSTSPKNLVKATINALQRLQNREQVERTRGVELPRGAGELRCAGHDRAGDEQRDERQDHHEPPGDPLGRWPPACGRTVHGFASLCRGDRKRGGPPQVARA
jgi:hypothetical protein